MSRLSSAVRSSTVLFTICLAATAYGHPFARVVSLTPCTPPDVVASTKTEVKATFELSVSADQKNSWDFEITIRSIWQANGAVDCSYTGSDRLAPGTTRTAEIFCDYNSTARLGIHELRVTIDAIEVPPGMGVRRNIAGSNCTYNVVKGAAGLGISEHRAGFGKPGERPRGSAGHRLLPKSEKEKPKDERPKEKGAESHSGSSARAGFGPRGGLPTATGGFRSLPSKK